MRVLYRLLCSRGGHLLLHLPGGGRNSKTKEKRREAHETINADVERALAPRQKKSSK